MINGRDTMLNSLNDEIKFLSTMMKEDLEVLSLLALKTKAANDRMDRFEQRSEMCFKLKEELDSFQAGMDALRDMGTREEEVNG